MSASLISEITAILSNILAAIAAFLGIVGITQWRRQLKFGDQYKTAHRVIGLCLRFKREFGLVRRLTPICALIQTATFQGDLIRFSASIQEDFNERNIHLMELYRVVQKLYEESLEIEGYLGDKEIGLTIPLENIYKVLSESFEDYRQFTHALQTAINVQETLERLQKNYEILFSDKYDPLMKRIDNVIENIQKRLKKYIR